MYRSKQILGSLLILFSVASLGGAQEEEAEQKVRRRVVIDTRERGEVSVVPGNIDDRHQIAHLLRRHDLAAPKKLIGVHLVALTPDLLDHFGVDSQGGVMVSKLLEGAGAERAGVRVGDVLTRINDVAVEGTYSLTEPIQRTDTGGTVALQLYRDGRRMTLEVPVDERERKIVHIGPNELQLDDLPTFVIPKIESLRELPAAIQSEKLAEALSHLQTYLQSDKAEQELERILEFDWSQLEDRLEQLEKRLEELGDELERTEKE